jgi:hypothetical protein
MRKVIVPFRARSRNAVRNAKRGRKRVSFAGAADQETGYSGDVRNVRKI